MDFLNDEQRNKLIKALEIIKSVHEEMTYEHVEYDILKTTLGSLERDIKYEENITR